MPGNRARLQIKGLESKFDKAYFIHTISGQFPIKKIEAIDLKENLRKMLTRIFKFGCFSRYHAYMFEENKLDFLMQNLMLNRLAPISNPKNEKEKSSYSLFQLPFILRTISLRFPLLRAILNRWEVSSNSIRSRTIKGHP